MNFAVKKEISLRLLLSLSFLFLHLPAQANVYADYAMLNAPMSMYLSSSYLLQETSNQMTIPGYSDTVPSDPQSAPSLQLPASEGPIAPQAMAQGFPADKRAEAEKLLNQLLEGFCTYEAQLGLPPGDMSNALAVFIGGTYVAYTGKEISDPSVVSLANQIRALLKKSGHLSGAALKDKQLFYESLGMIGMMMALIQIDLNQNPNPEIQAKVKEVARNYFQNVLQLDPEQILISEKGLTRKEGGGIL